MLCIGSTDSIDNADGRSNRAVNDAASMLMAQEMTGCVTATRRGAPTSDEALRAVGRPSLPIPNCLTEETTPQNVELATERSAVLTLPRETDAGETSVATGAKASPTTAS